MVPYYTPVAPKEANHMTVTPTRLDQLVGTLRSHGCRITPQRLAVCRVLANSDGHPSVEQIYAQIRPDFPMTSLTTVYNTVDLLQALGEVLELGFGEGANRYDGRRPRPHPHLICIRCGEILDGDAPALEDASEELRLLSGYEILSQRLDFYGVCSVCQAREGVGKPSD
jgi:Fur family peroxide stress response transcriptional regulator